MNFTALGLPASLLPESFYLAGWLGLAILFWRWLMSGDWRRLAEPQWLNLFLGATVAVLALWQIRTGVKPGLAFHLYGLAALTLMFGFWRATFSGVLVLVANAAFGRASWGALGIDALLLAALPAAVSWNVYRFIERRLPNHFFIYVLGNGFFGAALSAAAIGVATTALMALAGVYPLDYLLTQYTPYATILLGWAEAFSTGMAVTMMAVYRPAWLETFDDAKYIQNK
ncbi:MAG: energy-coupling factor ABC transporter permease [Hydrogenophilales bacterium]|nr:energy-coupling factor ABC transporter permease [Hydrogenophilales bacterium]